MRHEGHWARGRLEPQSGCVLPLQAASSPASFPSAIGIRGEVFMRKFMRGFLAGLLVGALALPLLTGASLAASGYRSGKHNKVTGHHHGY
jgi:hypothetical protein